MDVLAADGVELGWLAWRAPAPVITVAVRTTVTMDAWQALDGVGAASSRAAPSLPAPLGVDLAPHKPEVDVLLGGFAYAPAPRQAMLIELAVAELCIRATVHALLPSTRIPLDPSHVRDDCGGSVALGVRPGVDLRCGAPLLAAAFDFATFQLARPEQRLQRVEDCAPLRMESLCPQGRSWTGRLPPPPRLAVQRRLGSWRVVPLAVDTIRVDTELGTLALVGRAVVEHPDEVTAAAGWAATSSSIDGASGATLVTSGLAWPS